MPGSETKWGGGYLKGSARLRRRNVIDNEKGGGGGLSIEDLGN